MEIRRLNYFVRVAQDGSLTKAAAILRIAQSALSRQMRLLEEELGVPLFDRTARGMRLTGEGTQLLASVAGPLRELELAIQNIRSGPSAVEANLALGLPPSIADLLARPLALALRAAFPNVRFRIIEGPTGGLVDWLSRGMIDFALLEETAHNDLLSEQKLLSLPLLLAGPPDSPIESDRTVEPAEALRLPLIVPSHHLGLRAVINDAAIRTQAKLDIRFEADTARLTKDLVMSGMGYAILPESYFRTERTDDTLRGWCIGDAALALDIFLCSRKGSQTSGRRVGAVEEFIARLAMDHLSPPRPN
ncbi:MAG TPA: LysR family transcriptional regulator [Sphingobium sp.]|uniref:LysR family transcriptional regulator n=1 Tax=Sphingobium sp. TaxID=1912891 RepID=UPI002ED36DC5